MSPIQKETWDKKDFDAWLRNPGGYDQAYVKALILSNKGLTSLPESIGNLTSLKSLVLENNQFTSLPESIGGLTNMEKLYLRDNALTSLPASIGNLTNLKVLDLDGNPSIRISRRLRDMFEIPDSVGIIEGNIVFKNLPRNAENAVMMEPIADGNEMVNFQGEYDLGRYYKKRTYNSLVAPKKNPFTRRAINSKNVVRYKAKVGGRRKTRKARKTRRSGN